MHVLGRNKQTLWYANPTGISYIHNADGLKTGDKEITYGTPVKVRMSMALSSGANNLGSQGMAELQRYGITTGYTHRAVTDDMSCDMGEESLVWYNASPENNDPHNFKVVRKAVSLNHIIFYLKEVDVA